MRVISGTYKGRKLEGFNIEGTRPTMDRVKESLFGMIQNHIKGATVLDLFAGTGSLGIEALSNGASKCIFVDNSKQILPYLKRNLSDIPNSNILETSYQSALSTIIDEFDIIFLDPPYYESLLDECLELICSYNLLANGGIIVCEYDKNYKIDPPKYLTVKKERVYGDKKITVYQM